MSEERYEIRGKIGQGGVGAVYRAYDRNLNREVAIKRVLTEEGFDANDEEDEATKALLKEATALCSVQHPHIVTVYDAGVDGDGPYVVMELLSGRTLEEMVERGTMTWQDFRETAVQCLEALIAAQELDLVHRDIKPSNVMVTWLPSGKFQVKLVDFGLAKFSSKPSLQTIDHGDAVFGSIHFMAPEQFERIPLDQRTDMYSLGCVLFFCLAGNYPFDGDTAPQVMAAHLQNDFHSLREYRPDLPDWVCQWVEWHIARSPDDRPRDAREALERFLAFDQPVPQTAPVAVQAVPAASLPSAGEASSAEGGLSRLTGPVPVVPAASTESQPVAADAPARAKLLTGPVVGEASPAGDSASQVPSGAGAPAAKEETGTVPVAVPQPITPPPGAKPSVHTSAQVVRATGSVQTAQFNTPAAPVTPEVAQVPQPPQPPQPAQPAQNQSSVTAVKPVKGSGNAVRIAIAAVLTVAIVVIGILLVDVMGKQDEKKELQGLMQQAADSSVTDISLSRKHVEGFLAAASALDFDSEKGAVYQTLYLGSSIDGTDIDKRIAEFATTENITEQVRVKLFQVVGKRGGKSAVPFLMKFAKSSNEEDSVASALDAIGKNIAGEDLNALYKIISSTQSANVRAAAERAVKRHLQGQTNNSIAARDLVVAFQSSMESKPKETFLRLLGVTGSSQAEDAVEEALSSDDNTLKVSAYAALANWRNDTLFDRHLESMIGEEEKFLRGHAFESLLTFLSGDAEFDEASEKKMWTALSKELQDELEKKKFISTLARGSEDWAIALIEPFRKDAHEETSFLAERAIEAMKNREK